MIHPIDWCRKHIVNTRFCGCTIWPFHKCALCQCIVSENDVMSHLIECVNKYSKLPADEILTNFEYRSYALFAFIINKCEYDNRIDIHSTCKEYFVFEVYNHFYNDLTNNPMIIFTSELDDLLYNVFKVVVKEPYTRFLNIVPGLDYDDIKNFRAPQVRLIELFSRTKVRKLEEWTIMAKRSPWYELMRWSFWKKRVDAAIDRDMKKHGK